MLGDLRRAALLHDIGKLAISNRILDKPARLTEAEYALVRRASAASRRAILERAPGLRGARAAGGRAPRAARRQRATRTGSTRGALTMPMRVLAVADVYEALTSARPYRPAYEAWPRRSTSCAPTCLSRLDGDAFSALTAVLGERRPEALPAFAA